MSLIERLQEKQHEVDRWCRDNSDHRDYLWMCNLRALLDDSIENVKQCLAMRVRAVEVDHVPPGSD